MYMFFLPSVSRISNIQLIRFFFRVNFCKECDETMRIFVHAKEEIGILNDEFLSLLLLFHYFTQKLKIEISNKTEA